MERQLFPGTDWNESLSLSVISTCSSPFVPADVTAGLFDLNRSSLSTTVLSSLTSADESPEVLIVNPTLDQSSRSTFASSLRRSLENVGADPTVYSTFHHPDDEDDAPGCGRRWQSCWSWFCGLNGDQEESSTTNGHAVGSDDPLEQRESPLTSTKERPGIRRFLNANLIVIFVFEITLFVVFSLPARYTFLKD